MNQVVSTYLAIKSKLFQNQHLQSELNTIYVIWNRIMMNTFLWKQKTDRWLWNVFLVLDLPLKVSMNKADIRRGGPKHRTSSCDVQRTLENNSLFWKVLRKSIVLLLAYATSLIKKTCIFRDDFIVNLFFSLEKITPQLQPKLSSNWKFENNKKYRMKV